MNFGGLVSYLAFKVPYRPLFDFKTTFRMQKSLIDRKRVGGIGTRRNYRVEIMLEIDSK
jgi:hypothetical protein